MSKCSLKEIVRKGLELKPSLITFSRRKSIFKSVQFNRLKLWKCR